MEKWRWLRELGKIGYTKKLSQIFYENMNDCTWQQLVCHFILCQ